MVQPGAHLNPSQRPSTVRRQVLLLGFLATGITYLDRVCIAAAAPRMMAELGLSHIQMGYVFSIFAMAYGLFEVPAGWLSDRMGQRRMLTRIVACWSVFTALTGLARALPSLLAIRFVFGAAEAGAFPTIARAFARWFPVARWGRVNGIMWMGARLGGAAAPPIAGLLIEWLGWRSAFLVFGVVGLVWCAAFWNWYRDDPAQHPSVNAAELAYIRSGGPAAPPAGPVPPAPWKRIFLNGNLWALFWMYFATSYGFWFFLTWLPTYLVDEHKLPVRTAGFYAAFPLATGALTCLVGGALSDWLVRRTGSLRWGRRIVGLGGFLLAAAGFAVASRAHTPVAAVFWLSFASGSMDLAVPVAWATCLNVGGRFGGTVSGFMNTASSISAFLSPLAAAAFLNAFGSFGAMFASAAVVYFTAGLLWLKIDATRSIDQRL